VKTERKLVAEARIYEGDTITYCVPGKNVFGKRYPAADIYKRVRVRDGVETKKAREWTVTVTPNGLIVDSVLSGEPTSCCGPDRLVNVREILPGEVVVTKDKLVAALKLANEKYYSNTSYHYEEFLRALGVTP
jgi:hypothetical protein